MKKIEAIIRPGLRDAVVAAIKKNGVGGITIHHVQGQGSQDPPLVGQYFSSDMIICVVDDPKLEDTLESIASVACTGTKGDGKVFVTTVDDALDICTKKRGTTSI
jgi:nitrogen regulatory protein P-II 1